MVTLNNLVWLSSIILLPCIIMEDIFIHLRPIASFISNHVKNSTNDHLLSTSEKPKFENRNPERVAYFLIKILYALDMHETTYC